MHPNTFLRPFMALLFLLLATLGFAQGKHTLSGYLRDADSGETLIGATVYLPATGQGTTTNEYGFYSLSLEPGALEVRYSYVGYADIFRQVNLDRDVTLSLELGGTPAELAEVVVTAKAANEHITNLQMSTHSMDVATISKLPALMGEVEVLRSIQLLPGVSTVGEGATGFNVRGGSIDQNLVLLDEAPVYNSAHLFGFFSVFNPDAVKDVELYKGGIPARYGGRLSSILDVRMKEGNSKRLAVNGGVGLIFSRLAVEAPIIKDKASFLLAGRRSYADVVVSPFMKEGLGDNTLNFYDLTLKSNYRLKDNNQLFLSGYFGRDNFTFGDNAGFNWGNKTGTLRWNHLFSNRLFANTTLYYSNYDYSLRFGDGANDSFDWSARIINTSVKPQFTWFLSDRQQLRFGGQAIRYEFQPANAEVVTDDETLDISLDKRYALQGDLYLEHELSFGSRWQMNYGLRWSIFNLMGKGEAYTFGDSPAGQPRPLVDVQTYGWGKTIQSYNNWEPRAALRFQVNPEQSLKLSYNRTVQYIHLVSNTIAATPVDVWLPSTNNVQPQQADQVAVGYFRNFHDNAFEASVEAYYKDMRHQVDYVDGANLMLNEYVEGQVLEGRGRAYGLEFLLRKNTGRLTGWLSYTLSRSERLVEGINNDEWYANRFDQTHNLSLTGMYELSDRWSFSAVFVYNSGTPANFPTSRYQQGDYVIPHNTGGERNNVRIPGYHRLDLSATLQGKHNAERRWQSYWVFSVYNAYNRQNPFALFARQNPNRPVPGEAVTTEAVRFSVVGHVIPSVAYNFKF